MKLIIFVVSFMIIAEINAKKLAIKDKRQGFLNIGGSTAYPTIPPLINQLTSTIFQKNNVTGISPIYQFLSSLTSNIYPAVANATYNFFTSINPLINGVSSNLYNGLCSPPYPTRNPLINVTSPISPATSLIPLLLAGLSGSNSSNGGSMPMPMPGSLSGGTNPTATPGSSSFLGSLTNTSNILSMLSGSSPGSPTTSPAGSLGSILPLLLGGLSGGNNSNTNPLSSLSGSSPGSSFLGSLTNASNNPLGSLSGSLTGNPSSNPLGVLGSILPFLGSPSNSSGSSAFLGSLQNLLNPNPLSFLNGVTGTNGVNGTLNLSPDAFTALLNSLGQTPQSLQNALNALGLTVLAYINAFVASGQQALQYLQSIFTQPTNPTTNTTGLLGTLDPTLTGLGETLSQLLGSLGQSG